jgi:hypothetical protein
LEFQWWVRPVQLVRKDLGVPAVRKDLGVPAVEVDLLVRQVLTALTQQSQLLNYFSVTDLMKEQLQMKSVKLV